ncbi:taste receptor type 2 member 9-like [Lissotriton helveticus]
MILKDTLGETSIAVCEFTERPTKRGQKMKLFFTLEYLTITLVFEVVGILTSAFTVAFNLLKFAKVRTLNTCDLIVVAQGFSSACYQCTTVGQSYITSTLLDVHGMNYVASFLSQLEIWSGCSYSWFTACLYVFYCVEIVDFNHHIFIWLKLRISKLVPWLLLGSMVGSLVLSITLYWSSDGEYLNNGTINHTAEGTVNNSAANVKSSHIYAAIIDYIPLFIDIVSMTFILMSLYRHTKRMKENASGISQLQLDCHYEAARMLGSLLFFNILFVFSEVFKLCTQDPFLQHISSACIEALVTAQSIVLLLGNTKRRQALWKVLTSCMKLNDHAVNGSRRLGN